MTDTIKEYKLPDSKGYFRAYGGSFVPPELQKVLDEIAESYAAISKDETFIQEPASLNRHFTGRPSPVFHAKNLSRMTGGADIFLKREDLNHTGAHKINHCLGQALVAKRRGKTILVNLSGRGDKDIDFIIDNYGGEYGM